MIREAFFQKYTAYTGTNAKPAAPLQPMAFVAVVTSADNTKAHKTKNRLIRKVNVTKTM